MAQAELYDQDILIHTNHDHESMSTSKTLSESV